MKDKTQILGELDAAIDNGDMQAVRQGLDALSTVDSLAIAAEDPKLFSARIEKLYKEKQQMNKPNKMFKAAVVAAVVMALGVTVYAASALNLFSFQEGDKFVTVRTTESMTEQEARELAQDPGPDAASGTGAEQADVEEYTFDSVEEAGKGLDMDLILPGAMPEMDLQGITAQTVDFGDGVKTHTCWINYADNAGRMMGITTTREVVPTGASVTGYTISDIDDGSLGSYKSKSGVEYTTLTESDESGEMTAHIAVAMEGEYEYALVFVGFSEEERAAVIDSADLSAYR